MYRRTILKEDLDELERHVRDEVEAGIQSGLTEEQSFRQSVAQMGHLPTVDAEYQKIYWGKLRRRGALRQELSWRGSMLKNYFSIAVRLLVKQRATSAINILGLSVGLASCLLIFLFVSQEWSYDSFHTNADQIYRVYRTEDRVRPPNKTSESTPTSFGPTVQELVPGIAASTRWSQSEAVLSYAGVSSNIEIFWADPAFFDMFDFTSTGQGQLLLRSPESVVITESAAARYFPSGVSVGTPLDLVVDDGVQSFEVSGIVKDPPTNSSFQFEFIGQFGVLESQKSAADDWSQNDPATYVLLEDKVDPRSVEAGFLPIIETFLGDNIKVSIERGWWQNTVFPLQYHLQPLSEVHLTPGIDSFYFAVSDPLYSYILMAISLGVLLIACVNFVMLSVGRASTRAREVGMRKSLGANRSQLIGQFGGEALVMTSLAVGVGLLLAYLVLPAFNDLANQQLVFSGLFTPQAMFVIVLLTLFTGLLAGIYPAIVLASYEPMSALKKVSLKVRGVRVSQFMIVGQFVVSVALIVAVMVMQRQMKFISQQDLGYDAEQILVVDLSGTDMDLDVLSTQYERQIASISGVLGSSASSTTFGNNWSRMVIQEAEVNHIVYTNRVAPSFLDVMGIQLVDGRNFSEDLQMDAENAVIVNETMAAEMGWADPIGNSITQWPGVSVIGVVKDFNILSAKEKVPPMLLHMSPNLAANNYMLIRINMANTEAVLADLQKTWTALSPIVPFRSVFLDQSLQLLYESDRRWQSIINYTAVLALLISALGLFGMAALSISRRTKEIGIRKVLGASGLSIARLISSEFTLLVLIAIAIAAPLAYWVMSKWLSTFAYQIEMGLGVFALAGFFTLGIALLTVSFQTLRAANSNPVDSLKVD